MKKTTKKPSIGSAIWLNNRFDKLERDHLAIIKLIDKLALDHKAIVILLKGGNVSKELEMAILRTAGLSVKIDRKVPDIQPNRRTT